MLQELHVHHQFVHVIDIKFRVSEVVSQVDTWREQPSVREVGLEPLVTTQLSADIGFEAAHAVAVEPHFEQHRKHILRVEPEAYTDIVRSVLYERESQDIAILRIRILVQGICNALIIACAVIERDGVVYILLAHIIADIHRTFAACPALDIFLYTH